jgi:hypothetical protein
MLRADGAFRCRHSAVSNRGKCWLGVLRRVDAQHVSREEPPGHFRLAPKTDFWADKRHGTDIPRKWADGPGRRRRLSRRRSAAGTVIMGSTILSPRPNL